MLVNAISIVIYIILASLMPTELGSILVMLVFVVYWLMNIYLLILRQQNDN